MNDYSKQVVSEFMIRKGRRKKAFIEHTKDALQKQGYNVSIEQKGVLGSKNIVVGIPETADVILTAHYDTCANMVLPNICIPKNITVYLIYQFFITFLLLGIAALIGYVGFMLTNDSFLARGIELVSLLLLLLMIYVGPANKCNYNDNTSGVLTLLETAFAMPEELRNKVAFVFFDHEELGLVGSSNFAKSHPKVAANTLLLNFDCVGEGNHWMCVHSNDVIKDNYLYDVLRSTMTGNDAYEVIHASRKKAFYPSDQIHFKKGVGVLATKKAKVIGLYFGRIHTSRDVICSEENIEYLKDHMIELVAKI